MPLKTADYMKTLEIDTRSVLDHELDRLVEDAIQHALVHPGHGILVTRLTPNSFTVELSLDVPHGIIAELDLSAR